MSCIFGCVGVFFFVFVSDEMICEFYFVVLRINFLFFYFGDWIIWGFWNFNVLNSKVKICEIFILCGVVGGVLFINFFEVVLS